MDPLSVEMNIGESSQLQAIPFPTDATIQSMIWSSSNTSVASVSESGLVTAIDEGLSTITVSVNEKHSSSCKVKVYGVVSADMDLKELSLQKGHTQQLTVSFKANDTKNHIINWRSSNPEVATVGRSGLVTAVGRGNTEITAEVGGRIVSCSVEVFVPIESFIFKQTELSIVDGSQENLVLTILPEDATVDQIIWESSDTGVASVSDDGVVSAHREGTVNITATCGSFSANCEVVITPLQMYDGEENGHRWVDLGLPSGLKWATCNVGALSFDDNGDLFAWGETSPKSYYSLNNYKWYDTYYNEYTKYVFKNKYLPVDWRTSLTLEDDAANVNWGGKWRTPTMAQYEEILHIDHCKWYWVTIKGVQGIKVVSIINNNSIFFPMMKRDGYDQMGDIYWNYMISSDGSGDNMCVFGSSESGAATYYGARRPTGRLVRPVCKP